MAPGSQRCRLSTFHRSFLLLSFLWSIGAVAQQVANVPALIQTFTDTNQPYSHRIEAVERLRQAGSSSQSAVASVLNVALDKSENPELRLAAIGSLRRICSNEQSIVPGLIVVLKDKYEKRSLRTAAFEAYLSVNPTVTAFTDVFGKILADQTESAAIRDQAAKALALTATRIAAHVASAQTQLEDVKRASMAVEEIRKTFQAARVELHTDVDRASSELAARQAFVSRPRGSRLGSFVFRWRWPLGLLLIPLLSLGTWSLLLWRSPILLWRINEYLKGVPEFSIPGREMPIGLRSYLLVSFFNYHPRVLDAWLETRWPKIVQSFNELPTVARRRIHLPLPVAFSDRLLGAGSMEDFRPFFIGDRACVSICGESGSGKTSLGCQLARWAMEEEPNRRLTRERLLPLLLEDDFNSAQRPGPGTFADIIHENLCRLLPEDREVSISLAKNLVKQKRILVLLDGCRKLPSELSRLLMSSCEELPSHLIVSSSFRGALPKFVTTVIEPHRIEVDHLSEFIGAYLKELGRRDLFADREFLEMCVRLSEVVGERNITPFIAKVYLEQAIHCKEGARPGPPPQNVPDLMMQWLMDKNQSIEALARVEPAVVQHWAKVVAWECVRTEYRVASTTRRQLAERMRDELDVAPVLNYLAGKVRLIEPFSAGEDRIRMGPDTAVEYLAGLRVVDLLGAHGASWRELIADLVKKNGTPALIKDFVLALRDCCLAKGKEARIPEFVEVELGRLAGLDATAIENARLQIRIRRLTQQLSLPNIEDRKDAAVALGTIGRPAQAAIPALVARLISVHENFGVRQAAIKALGDVGAETDEALAALIEALKDAQNRLRPPATKALVQIGGKAIAVLVELLKNKRQDEEVRATIASTLGEFEPTARSAIPVLVDVLRDKQETEKVRSAAADALGRIGQDALAAVPDLVEVMQENKTLRRSAAKALIGIAPAAKSAVISLFQELNREQEDGPEEVLATFRLSLVQTGEMTQSGPANEVRLAVEEVLKKIDGKPSGDLAAAGIISAPV